MNSNLIKLKLLDYDCAIDSAALFSDPLNSIICYRKQTHEALK